MVQRVPPSLRSHESLSDRLEDRAAEAAVLAWSEVSPAYISESWEQVVPAVAAVVSDSQVRISDSAVATSRNVSVETGQYRLPRSFHDPRELVGYGSQGVPLEDALYSPAIGTKNRIRAGAPVQDAMLYGLSAVSSLASTIVADTGREAMQMDMITRTQTGYVRVIEAGACSRCVVLAGKWFRWNEGFLRHPSCRCLHMPAASKGWAEDEGWYADPYAYFNDLSTDGQAQIFGEYNAMAIRDGADIYQVVNATSPRAGVYAGGRMTREGTTRRGNFRQTSQYQHRLTPQGIYGDGSRSREQVIKALEGNGYILPGGQDPAGVLRGQREGFGQMGRGGTRRAASQAVLDARRTGVRDPSNRYTATAAERRALDADRDWQMVRAGVNPYQAGAAERWSALTEGRTPPRGGSVPRTPTDGDMARAEAAYRRYTLGLDGGDPALPPHMRPGR